MAFFFQPINIENLFYEIFIYNQFARTVNSLKIYIYFQTYLLFSCFILLSYN
jgi:hypothetical protein